MLNNSSKGKDLAEKQLVVLGGSPDQQREFLETLNPERIRPRYGNDRRREKKAPISNKYALGYTYQDVLDADQEDTLARVHVYLLSNPAAALASLLRPLFTKKTVSETLVTILLDWSDPFKWPRQLRQWIRLLRSVIYSLDEETKVEMEEVMTARKERKAGPDAPKSTFGATDGAEQTATSIVPLGPGEWDEGLGISLSVVCIHTEKIERLEQDLGWQEDQFDFLMQWLRTVLLKHGASLIYTTNFDPNNLRILLHTSLGIESLLKRETAKHDVVNRDKILVPPNWDSWGKIRVLKKDFDPEAVSKAWSIEIQSPPEDFIRSVKDDTKPASESESAVAFFEAILPDPANETSTYKPVVDSEITVTVPDTQNFLTQQAALLEKLKADDEQAGRRSRKGAPPPTGATQADIDDSKSSNVADQIGPYQINVNGIDFDAEEATRRIRDREADRTREKDSQKPSGVSTPTRREKGADGGEAGKPSNEALANFFSDLMRKGKGRGSGAVSPTRGSPAPSSDRGRP